LTKPPPTPRKQPHWPLYVFIGDAEPRTTEIRFASPLEKSQSKRLLAILFSTLFLVMTGFGIVIPALPPEHPDAAGANE